MTEERLAEAQEVLATGLDVQAPAEVLGEAEETLEAVEELAAMRWYGTRRGKVTLLRCNDIGHVWGSAGDVLRTEVVVQLSSAPGYAFGFELRPGDPHLAANLAMLSALRDAFVHRLDTVIWFLSNGNKNCRMRRVQLVR